MKEPDNIKRVRVSSKEIAELLGIPADARIIDVNREVCIEIREITGPHRTYQQGIYGDEVVFEWREK